MRRYLSLSKSQSSSPRVYSEARASVAIESDKTHLTDNVDQSTVASIVTVRTPLPPATLKIKRVDHFYSRWSKKWKYGNSGSNAIPELRPPPSEGKDDPWQQYCFVVIREVPREDDEMPTFQIVVKSSYLLKACKDVIAEVQGVSWTVVPLQLDPKLFLAFLPQFQTYRDQLKAKDQLSEEDGNVVATVDVLIDYFRKDYRATVAAIENLTSHGEITFDLLYAILVPRTVVVTKCPVTGEPQALQLASLTKNTAPSGTQFYELVLEGIDVDDTDTSNVKGFCRIQSKIFMVEFEGTVKITTLDAYPIQFHPQEAELRRSLIARGKKWAGIAGEIRHMHYEGTGAFKCQDKIIKYNLNSRVMIDRANFRKLNPNYAFPRRKPAAVQQTAMLDDCDSPRSLYPPLPTAYPTRPTRISRHRSSSFGALSVQPQLRAKRGPPELTDDELLLASGILYGFSLADKLWLELNVEKIAPIEWNEEAFSNLVLPSDRKTLLQSLVEAHNADLGLDDFIKGKGRGLVVNLFGPPGVGKTLSAEATSEHVKRPLYVVGAGDLGTHAADLDRALQLVFELATAWKAIVLIDEADVFLEQRSLHDLERNAMVAVFLRHLEYYPAILFLTTNRVKTFDEAFLSRIHIAFHFHALSASTRAQVWTAFLTKAGVKISAEGGISEEELKILAEKDINGRQVKNATRTANSLAVSRGERLSYKHLMEVLNVMEHFSTEFENMKNDH